MAWQKYEPRVTLDLQRKQIVQVHRHRGFRHIWHPVITTWEDNQFRCIGLYCGLYDCLTLVLFSGVHFISRHCQMVRRMTAAVLAFLFLSVRGAFALSPIEAYNKGDFSLREEARSWPLLCHVDNSSGKINVSLKSHILSHRVSLFKVPLGCYAGHTTVEKLGRKLFRVVRTSQTCFNCQWLTSQRHEKNMHPNRM